MQVRGGLPTNSSVGLLFGGVVGLPRASHRLHPYYLSPCLASLHHHSTDTRRAFLSPEQPEQQQHLQLLQSQHAAQGTTGVGQQEEAGAQEGGGGGGGRQSPQLVAAAAAPTQHTNPARKARRVAKTSQQAQPGRAAAGGSGLVSGTSASALKQLQRQVLDRDHGGGAEGEDEEGREEQEEEGQEDEAFSQHEGDEHHKAALEHTLFASQLQLPTQRQASLLLGGASPWSVLDSSFPAPTSWQRQPSGSGQQQAVAAAAAAQSELAYRMHRLRRVLSGPPKALLPDMQLIRLDPSPPVPARLQSLPAWLNPPGTAAAALHQQHTTGLHLIGSNSDASAATASALGRGVHQHTGHASAAVGWGFTAGSEGSEDDDGGVEVPVLGVRLMADGTVELLDDQRAAEREEAEEHPAAGYTTGDGAGLPDSPVLFINDGRMVMVQHRPDRGSSDVDEMEADEDGGSGCGDRGDGGPSRGAFEAADWPLFHPHVSTAAAATPIIGQPPLFPPGPAVISSGASWMPPTGAAHPNHLLHQALLVRPPTAPLPFFINGAAGGGGGFGAGLPTDTAEAAALAARFAMLRRETAPAGVLFNTLHLPPAPAGLHALRYPQQHQHPQHGTTVCWPTPVTTAAANQLRNGLLFRSQFD